MNASEDIDRLDVIAVAPHPDDVELSCGGTLAKLVKQGYRVGIIDLTSGEPTPRGSLEIRPKEAEAAREAMGVHIRVNLDLPNRVLMDGPDARFALATAFRKYRPNTVITMAGRTPAASPDHHQGHLIVEAARFYSQLTKWDERFGDYPPHRIMHLAYAPVVFDAEQRGWHGQFVIDITDTIEQKLAAISCYESQFDEERLAKVTHWIRGVAIAMGGRCGFEYGEIFALPHPVGGSDLMQIMNGGKGAIAPPTLPGAHLPMG